MNDSLWLGFCLFVAYGFGVLTVCFIPHDTRTARIDGYLEGWRDGRHGSKNRYADNVKFKE